MGLAWNLLTNSNNLGLITSVTSRLLVLHTWSYNTPHLQYMRLLMLHYSQYYFWGKDIIIQAPCESVHSPKLLWKNPSCCFVWTVRTCWNFSVLSLCFTLSVRSDEDMEGGQKWLFLTPSLEAVDEFLLRHRICHVWGFDFIWKEFQ